MMPAAGHVTCSQGGGHCARTGYITDGFQFYKSKKKILIIFHREIFHLLSPVDGYRKGDEEKDIVEQFVVSLEWKCNRNVTLYSKDHHPQHSHGDGDLLHRVSQVGDYGVVPVILLLIMVVDNNVVK